MPRACGFSVIELLVAMTVMVGVTAAIFAVLDPSSSTFSVQTEAADMQQRLRVATETLRRDLAMAGAGPLLEGHLGSLGYFFAPLIPHKAGVHGDEPGIFRNDAIAVAYVPASPAQSTISLPMPARSGDVAVHVGPGCPPIGSLCGFSARMRVLIYDDTGAHDVFSVTGVEASFLRLRHEGADSAHVYPAGSPIVEVRNRAYYLRADAATGADQLARADGDAGSEVPVVDHVVGLGFEYHADPQPPRMRTGLSDPAGPWTTYGPKPPPTDVQTTSYPAGENCVFMNVGGTVEPRLPTLGSGAAALVTLTPAQLTDGPWCPDPWHPRRFDADLLRVRRIGVTVRIQSAIAAFRGPAGPLFARGGTSRIGGRFLPDLETTFQVSPRNQNLED
jgi:hypothetical protein